MIMRVANISKMGLDCFHRLFKASHFCCKNKRWFVRPPAKKHRDSLSLPRGHGPETPPRYVCHPAACSCIGCMPHNSGFYLLLSQNFSPFTSTAIPLRCTQDPHPERTPLAPSKHSSKHSVFIEPHFNGWILRTGFRTKYPTSDVLWKIRPGSPYGSGKTEAPRVMCAR